MEVNVSKAGTVRYGKTNAKRNGMRIEVAFPACILSTNLGCVPHLTQETFSYIPKDLHPTAVKVPLPSIVNHELTFSAYPGWSGDLMGVPSSSLMIVSTQDSLPRTRKDHTPTLNTTKAVSVWGNNGRILLSPERHVQLMSVFEPDAFEIIADGDTAMDDVSKKRVSKSYTNSLKFLNDTLTMLANHERLKSTSIIPALEGGNSSVLRTKFSTEVLRCLKDTNSLGKTLGFLVDGIRADKRLTKSEIELAKSSTRPLPDDKLRFIHGPRSPRDVLDLLECGVDVFDTSYPITLAQKHFAIVFHIPKGAAISENAPAPSEGPSSPAGVAPETLDLSDPLHRTSFEPLLKGCSCYTCREHTRAYIHHLVVVKELLAPVLLTLHNLQHYFRFFEALRESLRNGTYLAFRGSLASSGVAEDSSAG